MEINEGFVKADHFLRSDNDRLCAEIYRRQYDPQTRFDVVAWIPAVAKVRSLDSLVERYLDSVKGKIKEAGEFSRESGRQVAHRFSRFERNLEESLDTVLPNVNEYIRKDIDEEKLQLNAHRDSLLLTGDIPITSEMISKIALDFRLLENHILSYCEKVSTVSTDVYDRFDILAGLDNRHLKAGEPIEVFAGIGAFSLTPWMRGPEPKLFLMPH